MEEYILISLGMLLLVGVLAQWLGWRYKLPAILILLVFGILVGPVTGLLHPDELLGDLLFPFVSFSVALILFEGGLSLNFHELQSVGPALGRLVSIGALVTWGIATLASYYLLKLPLGLSLLEGAILIVSGPTVVQPLLTHIRPKPNLASLLKWEGIVIDPIGATLAVLVFQVLASATSLALPLVILLGLLRMVVIGGLLGLAAAFLLILLLDRHWIPDYLQNPATLAMVILSFIASNLLQSESGLLAVVVMGVAMANQRRVPVRHIVAFKETLRVLLLSALFILLAARLDLNSLLAELNWRGLVFLLVLVLVVRPLSVLASTLRAPITWRERAFLSWLNPRGIVAASVSSIFAFQLVDRGFNQADRLASITFMVIIFTVVLYSLTSGAVARWLKVAAPPPKGVLVLGAHDWARQIAKTLKDQGVEVMLLDSNSPKVEEARREGLNAVHGNVLSEGFFEEVPLDGIGSLVAMTSNDEVNSLAALRMMESFGRAEVYHLPATSEVTKELRGRTLFGPAISYRNLEERFRSGASIQTLTLSKDYSFNQFRTDYGSRVIPLFTVNPGGEVQFFTVEKEIRPDAGQKIVALVEPGIKLVPQSASQIEKSGMLEDERTA